jgi:hypothetical protein
MNYMGTKQANIHNFKYVKYNFYTMIINGTNYILLNFMKKDILLKCCLIYFTKIEVFYFQKKHYLYTFMDI